MSEKKFEECSLEDATYIEVGGKVHLLGSDEVIKEDDRSILISAGGSWQLIHSDAFPILGIKPLKEIKPEPIEFEATFAKYLGNWIPLYTMHDGFLYEDNKKARFKCVQILEDEE